MVAFLSLVSGASIPGSGSFVIHRAVGSFADAVCNRGGHEAIRLGAGIVSAGPDPAHNLGDELPGLAFLGISGIH